MLAFNESGWRRENDVVSCFTDIRMHKVIALVEQRFAFRTGQRISKAVAEVQVGLVSTPFAVIAIRLTGNASLLCSRGFDANLVSLNDLFKSNRSAFNLNSPYL